MKERFADWITELRRWTWRPERGRVESAYWWALPLLPLLLLVAVLIPYDVLYHLTYLWGFLLLICWAWVRYQGPRVDLSRELQTAWAQVGDELEEHWQLRNTGFLPVLWLELNDGSTLPGYSARRVAATGMYGAEQWFTNAVCRRRGRYHLGPLAVEMSDPLGLFRYRRVEAITREMIVYPPLVQLPTLERPRGQRGGVTRASLLNILPTPNAGGLREYRPGDPLSFVHWRAVARTGKLMVKEFDQEIAGAVWIVLDLARDVQFGSGDSASEELGVVLACSLANLMLAEGRIVGLFSRGAEPHLVRPGRGRQHVWEIMSALVDAHADGAMPLAAVLKALHAAAPGRHAVVVITPDTDSAWVEELVALSGGGSAAQALLLQNEQETHGITGQLDRLGVAYTLFRAGEHLPLLTPLRQRGPTYRVSPLGRMIRVEA